MYLSSRKAFTIALVTLAAFAGMYSIGFKEAKYTYEKYEETTGSLDVPLRSFEATVTAYSALDSCHFPGCPMANGIRAELGYAACPRDIALGTLVDVGGTVYVCGDRTARRYDGRFDIFMGFGEAAHTEALQFGIKTMRVTILGMI